MQENDQIGVDLPQNAEAPFSLSSIDTSVCQTQYWKEKQLRTKVERVKTQALTQEEGRERESAPGGACVFPCGKQSLRAPAAPAVLCWEGKRERSWTPHWASQAAALGSASLSQL